MCFRWDVGALVGAVLLSASACATAPAAHPSVVDLPFGDPGRRDREAALVLDAITDTRTGAVLTPAELAQRLSGARLVFVGESHTHLDSHIAQARLIDALAATGRPVLVGLEMFPRDDATDEALRAWSEERADENTFLRESHWYKHWGYPFGYYRDVFGAARRNHLRLFGVNAPRAVITAVRAHGFDRLAPDQKAHLPPHVDTTDEEHRRLFRAFFAGADATHGPALPADAWEGMFRAQCAWDGVMAWNALRAIESHDGSNAIVVVLLGAGHVAYGLGAPRQAVAYGAKDIASVITVPVVDDEGRPARVRASYADYVWTIPPEPDLPPFPTLGLSVADGDTPGKQNPKVVMVSPDSPAARAGVQAKDLLISLDNAPVSDQEALSRLMAEKRWGDGIRITVRRNEQTLVLSAALRRSLPAPDHSRP